MYIKIYINRYEHTYVGRVPEWSNGLVLRTSGLCLREFESRLYHFCSLITYISD